MENILESRDVKIGITSGYINYALGLDSSKDRFNGFEAKVEVAYEKPFTANGSYSQIFVESCLKKQNLGIRNMSLTSLSLTILDFVLSKKIYIPHYQFYFWEGENPRIDCSEESCRHNFHTFLLNDIKIIEDFSKLINSPMLIAFLSRNKTQLKIKSELENLIKKF